MMHSNKRPRQDDKRTKKQPLSCAECRRQAQAQGHLETFSSYPIHPLLVRSRLSLPVLFKARVC
ncbi:hypothetical protein L210DRAFT_3543565 [Boletus edulis BED1]|uniref:Uncharacterized protein n=1 Tax=Boletus edulis BED1 TaxID=1328754 RepID=A0AAD4GEF6_BOLED|nr:hypothetical protein L210DRAFT_3543565 [Boletus edulis BED1]